MQSAVLITGASKRIGKAIALGLAHDGYTILLHYLNSLEAAQETAKAIQETGSRCYLLKADLSNRIQCKELIEQAFQIAPSCNLLVNNASVFEAGTLMETTEELFEKHFLTNLKAPFFLTQGFAQLCKEQGAVINLLDTRIKQTSTSHFAYSLSKKTLYEFTRMAAKELAPRIRVNGVCPGLILPPVEQDNQYLEAKSQAIPLQRYGDVSQVMETIRFLVQNPFVTGDCVFLDGGEHLG